MNISAGAARSAKPKIECPGCGKKYVSLNGHLAKASGPCAELRAQRIINNTPGLTNHPAQSDTLIHSQNTVDPTPIDTQHSETTSKDDSISILIKESERFFTEIDKYVLKPPTKDNFDNFDELVKEFTLFLYKSNNQLPGPIHPAVSYHRKRKNKKDINCDKGNSQVSNPQRYSKKKLVTNTIMT